MQQEKRQSIVMYIFLCREMGECFLNCVNHSISIQLVLNNVNFYSPYLFDFVLNNKVLNFSFDDYGQN